MTQEGYALVDTNECYYNCGHFPEYIVKKQSGVIDNKKIFASKKNAESKALKLNRQSDADWQFFLNA